MTSGYDYVIVGGGSTGCVLAARLSQEPDVSVCLLEAGPSDVGDAAVLRLADWMDLLESPYDWDYPVEPQERGNSRLRHARAKVLGGCSSHNSAIAFWPPAEDLDEWAAAGATGWDAATCRPLLAGLETNDGPWDGHGRHGPVHIATVAPHDPCGVALLAAAAAEGLPTVRFNEGTTVCDGAGFFQLNRLPDGTRASASVSYLHPVLGRANLDVRTGAWATRVLFDGDADGTVVGDVGGGAGRDADGGAAAGSGTGGGPAGGSATGRRAVGVEYRPDGTGPAVTVRARREVIVCAGAIDTPKLLMLSGIGPAEHLREHGIAVRADLPGVGANLDDHVEGLVMWSAARPMVTRSTQWWEIGLFARTRPGLDRPDLMMHYGSRAFDLNSGRDGYPTAAQAFCLTPNVTRGRSRGTVRLRSADHRDKPRVDPRYFTDPDGHDMTVMLAGMRLARRIAVRPELAAWVDRELVPGPDVVTDDELADVLTRTHGTVYHPAGTARMGRSDDPGAVLDPQLRVRGIDRLRVADASVLPHLPVVNPGITCLLIGERAAQLLRET